MLTYYIHQSLFTKLISEIYSITGFHKVFFSDQEGGRNDQQGVARLMKIQYDILIFAHLDLSCVSHVAKLLEDKLHNRHVLADAYLG
jgi:hypothetical protein